MKKTILFLVCCLTAIQVRVSAQVDTTKAVPVDLLGDLAAEAASQGQNLLPNHMIPTQRLLWGEKGLMRSFNSFKLTPEERDRELKIRRAMLVTHQALGLVTLGQMVAQGIVGSKLYNGQFNMKDTHEALATGINITYFSTTGLALLAPPKMLDERKGYSSIKVHKYLALLHLASMITVDVLADQLEQHPDLRKYHRAAAFTAFGSLAAAMIVIKF